MRGRVAGWLVLALGLGGLVVCSGAGRGHAPQLAFLAWDGAADRVVDRLIEEGEMPNLAALAARGARAGAGSFRPATGHPRDPLGDRPVAARPRFPLLADGRPGGPRLDRRSG